jgi:RNA polymerase sigma-70 factor (ECF subfamily)
MHDKWFEITYLEHGKMVKAYLHSILGNWEDADDLTQETFVIAYRKLDEFKRDRPIAAWLRGIARNEARNALRKRKNKREIVIGNAEDVDRIFAAFDAGNVSDADSWEERLKLLGNCMAKLPEDQRTAMDLHYLEDKNAGAIARITGFAEKTIFNMLWSARKNLKQCIQKLIRAGDASHA